LRVGVIIMRYDERPQAEVKVLGTNTNISKTYGDRICKIVREQPDDEGKYKVVKFYDLSGNLILISELQELNGVYEYRKETRYDSNGVIQMVITYRLIYDQDGNLISEEEL